ncbi:MAG: hypothetical protein ABI333_26150 [bacterium]
MVDRTGDVYLQINDQSPMTRPYLDFEDQSDYDGAFAAAMLGAEVEYAGIRYCICAPIEDSDGDEVPDHLDNCPNDHNADQSDTDGDGIGDVCDPAVPLDIDLPIDVSDGSVVDFTGYDIIIKNGGSITIGSGDATIITNGAVVVEPGGLITADGQGEEPGGSIHIRAAAVAVNGEITANSGTDDQQHVPAPKAGTISIEAGSLSVDSGGRISADGLATNSEGGAVSLDITGPIDVTNQSTISADGSTEWRIFGEPNGGEIKLRADTLLVSTASRVTADGRAANAKGGEVMAAIVDQATIGQDSRLSADGGPTKRPFGKPDGGRITLYANNLLIAEGGLLSVTGGQRADGGHAELWTFNDLTINGRLEGRGGESQDVQRGAFLNLGVTGTLTLGPTGFIDTSAQDRGGTLVAHVMGDADIQGVITCTAGSGAFQQNGGITKLLTAGDVTISGAIDVSGQENWVWQDGIRAPNGAYVNVSGDDVTISGAIFANGGSGGGHQCAGSVLLRASDHLTISGTVHALGEESISGHTPINIDYASHDFTGADIRPPPPPPVIERIPDSESTDNFGFAVAMDGEYAIVGVPGDNDDVLGDDAGAVYIYKKMVWAIGYPGGNYAAWIKQARVTCPRPHDSMEGWRCGHSVDIKGDWAAVGCPLATVDYGGPNTPLRMGAVWILHRQDGAVTGEDEWQCDRLLISPDPSHDNQFGFSLDFEESAAGLPALKLIVGEPQPGPDPGNQRPGRAHIFRYDPDLSFPWDIEGTCENPDNRTARLNFGYSVALMRREETAFIGYPGYEEEGQGEEVGRVYVCNRDVIAWQISTAQSWISSEQRIQARFGYSIATGITENPYNGEVQKCVVIGSPLWAEERGIPVNQIGLVEMKCYGHRGEETWQFHHPEAQRGSRFGGSLALDNSLLLIGAPRQITSDIPVPPQTGIVYAYRYWEPGWPGYFEPYWDRAYTFTITPIPYNDSRYGAAVAVSGNPFVNIDAVVGAPQYWDDQSGGVDFYIDL